ncbi:sulfhydryl oxidase 1-like [Lethenteron reissneri]|uniref:sulfhydryl oxidase 1-like n=1 Tax=Lethenteron reissneri TaxID=7753 RepID=UPI002AB5F39C|nr:sulfhydryl oxidase 1-like [Lethenteron reissneri]
MPPPPPPPPLSLPLPSLPLLPPLLLLLFALVLGGSRAGLYETGGPVVELGAEGIRLAIVNSTSAWAVHFYTEWCGHCADFAPVWTALAKDITDWGAAVRIAAFNCAGTRGRAYRTCRDLGVRSWPQYTFYKAFSNSSLHGDSYPELEGTMQALRRWVISRLLSHAAEEWPPACPPLEPASPQEVMSFPREEEQGDTLALIFEEEESFVGREVILDLLAYERLSVRRVLSSESSLVSAFAVDSFPTCLLLHPNGTRARVHVRMAVRSFFAYELRRLPGVTRGESSTVAHAPGDAAETRAPWREFDGSRVYMADLEGGLHFALRVEVGTRPTLSGASLAALKNFVRVLVKFFPGRVCVLRLLESVLRWLEALPPRRRVTALELERLLDGSHAQEGGDLLPDVATWVGCQGSGPRHGGLPCALWGLFHVLAASAAIANDSLVATGDAPAWDPLEVLRAVRGYVAHFFSCRTCALHFDAAVRQGAAAVRDADAAALWLWRQHNHVNARLAGSRADDPAFPKAPWPPAALCPECRVSLGARWAWDEASVLRFLKRHFSADNVALDFLSPPCASEFAGDTERPPAPLGHRGRGAVDDDAAGDVAAPPPARREDPIVDLDAFEELQLQRWRTQGAAAAAVEGDAGRRAARTMPTATTAAAVVEEAERWRRVGGSRPAVRAGDFSAVDAGLCALLYACSSLCLLAVYSCLRRRVRGTEGARGRRTAAGGALGH